MTSNQSPAQGSTLIFLCQDLQGRLGDLADLKTWLIGNLQEVSVEILPDLCQTPSGISKKLGGGVGRVVVGLCSTQYAEVEIHSRIRKAGLDPVQAEIVSLGTLCLPAFPASRALETAKLLLVSAVSRARAYPGCGQDDLKPFFPGMSQSVSRRALFTLPPIRYKAVSSIRGDCAAAKGCDLCVRECRHGALASDGRRVLVSKQSCTGCGVCAALCPKQAIQLPGDDPAQLQEQVRGLLETRDVQIPVRSVLFICKRTLKSLERSQLAKQVLQGWLPAPVACTGMVTAGVILATLALGAARVGIATCGDECGSVDKEVVEGRVRYCKALLNLLEIEDQEVALVSLSSQPAHENRLGPAVSQERSLRDGGAPVCMFGGGAAATAVKRLLSNSRLSPAGRLEHPHSPFGALAIDAARCSGCGRCAESCPTGALALQNSHNRMVLRYEAALCDGCGLCIAGCPERKTGAIKLTKATDLAAILKGRTTILEDAADTCKSCGVVIASSRLTAKVASLLGDSNTAIAQRVRECCPNCRSMRATPSIPAVPLRGA